MVLRFSTGKIISNNLFWLAVLIIGLRIYFLGSNVSIEEENKFVGQLLRLQARTNYLNSDGSGVIAKEIFKGMNGKIPDRNLGRIPKGFIERVPENNMSAPTFQKGFCNQCLLTELWVVFHSSHAIHIH